jgi:hypothetical protein
MGGFALKFCEVTDYLQLNSARCNCTHVLISTYVWQGYITHHGACSPACGYVWVCRGTSALQDGAQHMDASEDGQQQSGSGSDSGDDDEMSGSGSGSQDGSGSGSEDDDDGEEGSEEEGGGGKKQGKKKQGQMAGSKKVTAADTGHVTFEKSHLTL